MQCCLACRGGEIHLADVWNAWYRSAKALRIQSIEEGVISQPISLFSKRESKPARSVHPKGKYQTISPELFVASPPLYFSTCMAMVPNSGHQCPIWQADTVGCLPGEAKRAELTKVVVEAYHVDGAFESQQLSSAAKNRI